MFCRLTDHFLPKGGLPVHAPVTSFSIYTPSGFFTLRAQNIENAVRFVKN